MIYLEIPSLPPSSNHAYANIRGTNQRVLTKEGRSYKTLTTAHLAQKYPNRMTFFKPNTPYMIMVRFWFQNIHNTGYPTKAAAKYKKIDVSNRVKLFEDALKDAAAIDDSQHITLILQKYEGSTERTEVWAWNLDEEETPFDDAFAML